MAMKWLKRFWFDPDTQERAVTDAVETLENATQQLSEMKSLGAAADKAVESIKDEVIINHFVEGVKVAWGWK